MIRRKITRPSAGILRTQIRDKKKEEKKAIDEQKEISNKALFAPSGSVLFNLACSDDWQGAYKVGTMVNLVGDSSSGKSFLALSGMAAMAVMPQFEDYRLIYDDAEFADSFDHEKLFGSKFVDRIESPNKENGSSTTVEQFFDNVMDALEEETPFVYCLDSFDAIDSDAEIAKEQDNRKYRKAGTLSKIKGSFQATKQKKASQMLRQLCSKLQKSNSLLIIISQTRDNIDPTSRTKQTRSGGRALKFYASIEMWLSYAGVINKVIGEMQHKIGVNSIAKITKNKYTGKQKIISFPIYYDYGIDDITSCIEYLIKSKYWALKKQTVIAPELDAEMTRVKLTAYIEKEEKEKILYQTVQKCWNETEEKLKLNRKSKFE